MEDNTCCIRLALPTECPDKRRPFRVAAAGLGAIRPEGHRLPRMGEYRRRDEPELPEVQYQDGRQYGHENREPGNGSEAYRQPWRMNRYGTREPGRKKPGQQCQGRDDENQSSYGHVWIWRQDAGHEHGNREPDEQQAPARVLSLAPERTQPPAPPADRSPGPAGHRRRRSAQWRCN